MAESLFTTRLHPIRWFQSLVLRWPLAVTCAIALLCPQAIAQPEPEGPAVASDLSIEQATLADRYQRLELVASRLAELSMATDPNRARLLRDAIARSRQQELDLRFESIVDLLEQERLTAAIQDQTALQSGLEQLLELLLKESRTDELESEQERVRRYLRELGRLTRWQRGIRARTEGGDDLESLSRDEATLTEETESLAEAIDEGEGNERDASGEASGETPDGESQNDSQDGSQSPEGGDRPEGQPAESPQGQEGTPSEGAPSEQPSEGRSGQSEGESQPSGDSPPSGESPPQSGGKSQPGSEGQPGGPSGGQQPPQAQQSQQPSQRAADRLRAAAERMQQAQQALEEAERDGATQEQQRALEALEEARAELERILRQLREEEMERILTMLAARFRRMLEAQVEVYEGTVRVDEIPSAQRDHTTDIEAARLSRSESLIMADADKALILLREEGSSVAFPEAVEGMREDMRQVVDLLAQTNVGELTQSIERDIIEALEESIAALERALEDVQQGNSPGGQQPSQGGMPQEPPLVDKLAELKMIRSLQVRIRRRTERYEIALTEQSIPQEAVLEALQELSERQDRVFQATRDLALGSNE